MREGETMERKCGKEKKEEGGKRIRIKKMHKKSNIVTDGNLMWQIREISGFARLRVFLRFLVKNIKKKQLKIRIT